ncbi:MAG: tetratricopeptide repeat protein, partial [bacterium]
METFQIKAVVQSFLDTGMIEKGFTEDELASICHKYIIEISRKSLRKSYQLAKEFVKQAGKFNSPLRIASYKTLATVSHLSGDYSQALKAYQNIKKYSGQDKLLKARIDRALIDVYMYLGEYKKAGDAARRAIRCFEALKSKSDLAMTRVNYANTLHRRDRHREAEELYHQAEKYFIKTNNKIAEARCSYNRANTLVQLFDFPKAEKLYRKAQSIYLTEDNKLDANDALYGLAWLHMLSGDFHVALLELSECEKTYHDSGDKRSETLCILDKAEIYLGLGLYLDSLELSRIAERKFKQLKLHYEKAKSAFFRAQAAHALLLKPETKASLKRAKAEFLKENNHGFLGAVYLLESDIQVRNKSKMTELLTKARKSFSKAQLPLWSILCDFRELENPNREKTALARLEKNGAVDQVPHLYAHWQVILGDYEYNKGKIKSAKIHWKKAADKLDLVRAELPPVELRNKYAHKQSSPHIRLIKSELDGQPIVSAAWSERYKTAGIWTPLSQSNVNQNIRKKTVESLDSLARRVAALSRHIGGDYGERKMSVDIQEKTLTGLRIKLHNKYIELENRKISTPDSINKLIKDFKSVSRRIPIIQFHVSE